MARFKGLTWDEARGLTRAQLLDRIEVEQRYWHCKTGKSDADVAAERTFRQIMHASIDIGGGLDAARAVLEGRQSTFWEERPLASYQPEADREAGR